MPLAQLPRDESAPCVPSIRGACQLARLLGGMSYPRYASRLAAGAASSRNRWPPWPDALATSHGINQGGWAGGVGKATIAAALAVGLVWGNTACLTTTDPASTEARLDGSLPGLKVGRIDPGPKRRPIDKISGHARQGSGRRRPRCCWKICSRPAPKRCRVHAFGRAVNEAARPLWCWTLPPPATACCAMERHRDAYHRQMTQQYYRAALGARWLSTSSPC